MRKWLNKCFFLFAHKKQDMISLYCILFSTLLFIPCKTVPQRQNPTGLFKKEVCKCSKYSDVSSRIIGGAPTEPHEYPWMAAIFSSGNLYCGGSLINNRYILTAGHCLNRVNIKDISVVLGLHDRHLFETHKKGGVEMEVEDIIIHENFTSKNFYDVEDIGLIKLKNPVEFIQKIRPICLPKNADEDYSGESAVIIGWGKVSSRGARAVLLKQANVSIISNEDCRKIPMIGNHIHDSMLCAYENEVDACQGDSGGPLFYEGKKGRIEQVGIVSWGIGCAVPGRPGIYTRTTSYLEWIAFHTRDAIYCMNTL